MKRFWSMPQWNFWFFISFVVFGAAVYRPSFMVDHTERRKTERKKFVNVSPLHHRPYNTERRSFVWERKIKFLNFYYATMNEWEDNISFCSFELWTERNLYRGRLHRFWRRKTAREKRKNVCFHHYIIGGPPQREKKY